MNLLVVDDDDDLREMLAELLVEAGHQVAVARDGEAALHWLDGALELPDLILLDWMMPRVDGLEFRQRQRQDPRLAGIPVVLMTAATPTRVPVEGIAPAAVIRKPTPLADLLRVLGQLGASRPGARGPGPDAGSG